MLGAVFAALIACALIASGVLPIVMEQGGETVPPVPPTQTADERSEFERQLRAEIEQQPENANLMVSLANLLVAEGASDEAIEWYERAIDLDPNTLAARLDFGTALARRGSLADAEVQYRRAIAIDDGNADAHFLLAELYRSWQPSRTEEAIAEYEQAIAAQPDSVAAIRAAEMLSQIQGAGKTSLASPVASPSNPTVEVQP